MNNFIAKLTPKSLKTSGRTMKRTIAAVTLAVASVAAPVYSARSTKFVNELDAYKAYTFSSISEERVKALYAYSAEKMEELKYSKLIKQIIQEDENAPKDIDYDKLVSQIISISKEYDVNPIDVACIVKKESHFVDNQNGKNGQGLMQITEIVTKDMFQRPEIYHERLSEFTKNYKDSKELFAELKKDSSTNIRTGILLYDHVLKKAKGNVKKALEYYNGSKHKESYARAVFSDINKYRQIFEKNS